MGWAIRGGWRSSGAAAGEGAGGVQAVQAFFKRMSPEILRAGVQTALPAYSENGRINEQIVTRFLELAYSVKLLTVPTRPSPKEGVLWTNRFIE